MLLLRQQTKMFGQNWKYHDEGAEIDVDTLPDKTNARRVGKCMALSEIVTEAVSSDDQSTITYANDGSKNKEPAHSQCKVLLLMVSIRALPTMSIASESKSNLVGVKANNLANSIGS